MAKKLIVVGSDHPLASLADILAKSAKEALGEYAVEGKEPVAEIRVGKNIVYTTKKKGAKK